MKVLVTGGGGFIGGRLADALLQQGTLADESGIQREISSITLFDLSFPSRQNPRLNYVSGDLSNPAEVAALIDADTTSVFHLASIVSGAAEADFDLGMRVNIDGTRAVLEACRHHAKRPRLVFASSVAVFGFGFPSIVEDSSVALPLNSYGAQKICCEYLINDYSRRGFLDGRVLRLPTIVVRPGKPNQAKSSYASGIIREPLNGVVSPCPVSPDTGIWILSPRKAIGALIHAHDLASSAWGTNRVLNLVGTTATASEMVEALRTVGGNKAADLVRWKPDADIQAFINSLPSRFQTSRAEAMGFVPDDNVETIIRQYAQDQDALLQASETVA